MVEFILPIAGAFAIGVFCRRRSVLSPQAVEGVKTLVTTFFLPLMSFRMFSQVQLEAATLAMIGLSFAVFLAALGLGFATRRLAGPYGAYYPFLISSAEGGMLGIGLYQMLYGAERLPYLAAFDLGCGLFFFGVFLPLLTRKSAQVSGRPAPEGGGGVRRFARSLLSVPVFCGCLAGVLFQLCGAARLMDHLGWTPVMLGCVNVFTALITPLMLIAVGYEFSVERETLLPALKTTLLRLGVMAVCLLLGAAALRAAGVGPAAYYRALALEMSLPAAFLVAMFVEGEANQKYVNTQLSIYVLVTLALAIGMKITL